MAYALFAHVMKYAPKHPEWIARDRFVLSNGHGCALHYAMLHLMGYDVSLDDLKNFRQMGSKYGVDCRMLDLCTVGLLDIQRIMLLPASK